MVKEKEEFGGSNNGRDGGLVLVIGVIGGVGKWVVDELCKNGV